MRYINLCLCVAMIGLFACGCEDGDSIEWNANRNESDSKTSTNTSVSDEPESGVGASDQVGFGSLRWNWGGVNGSKAAKTTATITGLSISGDSMSYRWAGDTLRSWGLSDGDASALACLFVQNSSGAWVGGKFDWISTSRTSRPLENVFSGYLGWSLSGVPNPCNAAFVIISKDGKKRTNVITSSWKR